MTDWNKKLGLDDLDAPDVAHYHTTESGTYWISYDDGKEQRDQLADAIRLIGRAVDDEGRNWRIIEWRDRYHATHRAALDMGDIGTPAGWRTLQSHGITIKAGRKKRERLADYLQGEGKNTRWQLAKTAGWHGGAYILPSGEVLGDAENLHYHGDTSQGADYQPRGSLADWQALARLAQGNSRLCLALGCAFAAPLLHLLDHESGGFHLYGDSSDGKTTAALFALTVWGNPKGLKLTWEGTAHGFSNTAAARNDGLLVLDEIGQASARTAAQTAYAVLNGTGKIQGAKDGGNREIQRWRIMLFSTGEKTLDGYLKTEGKDMGIYDTLHGFAGGAELSEHLTSEGAKHHGTAGRAYIAHLATIDAVGEARKHIDTFIAALPKQEGQARRVAMRFAIVAAALELAQPIHGLTDTTAAIRQCHDDWQAAHGSGKHEDRKIIEQTEDFMQTNSQTNRFTNWTGEQAYLDHIGYRVEKDGITYYWVNSGVFKNEIAKGFDVRKVCEVLHRIGWLLYNEAQDRWQFRKRGEGWYYVFKGAAPPDDADN